MENIQRKKSKLQYMPVCQLTAFTKNKNQVEGALFWDTGGESVHIT